MTKKWLWIKYLVKKKKTNNKRVFLVKTIRMDKTECSNQLASVCRDLITVDHDQPSSCGFYQHCTVSLVPYWMTICLLPSLTIIKLYRTRCASELHGSNCEATTVSKSYKRLSALDILFIQKVNSDNTRRLVFGWVKNFIRSLFVWKFMQMPNF